MNFRYIDTIVSVSTYEYSHPIYKFIFGRHNPIIRQYIILARVNHINPRF